MQRSTPHGALVVVLLAAMLSAGCLQGGIEFSLDPTMTRDAGSGSGRSDASDPSTPADEDLATLNITASVTTLEVGQRVSIDVSARTASDMVIEDISPQWHAEDEAVATFVEPGRLSAASVGQTRVWATAGGVESNRLDITVADPGEGGSRYVIVEPRQVALAAGQTFSLHAEVRRQHGALIEGLPVSWESSDESVVSVDDSGVMTAVDVGQAQVSAVVQNSEPLPVHVRVTEQPTWVRAQVVRPRGAIAARGEPVEVRVELREVAVGGIDELGTPLQPDKVEITIDGAVVGTADIAWDVASFTLDTTGLDEGLHRLAARVVWGGEDYTAPSRMVWAHTPAPAFADGWDNLSEAGDDRWSIDGDLGPTNGNRAGLAIDSQGTIYVALERPDRGDVAKLFVHRWNESEGRWRPLSSHEGGGRKDIQLRKWSSQYEYFPHETMQFVDLAVDDQDRLLVAFTQEGVDHGGNGDERQKRWFDVFVARYEDGFGPDGGAGWRLLTSGAQDYIVDPPKASEPQHPPPADVDEHDDVFTPQVLWDAQRSRITAVWASSPFPRETTHLDVRVWSDADASWTTVGERLDLEGSVPELREAFFEPSGGLVAVIENRFADAAGRYAIWRLNLDSGTWSRLDTAGRLADAAALDDGSFVAAKLTRGLLRGVSVRDGVESSGGQVLNRSAWVSANEPVFIHGNDGNHASALLWYEGAPGSQQWIYGASFADSSWSPLDVDLFTRTLGSGQLVAAVDPQGRLVIARQVPRPGVEGESPYSMLVVRSHERLFD